MKKVLIVVPFNDIYPPMNGGMLRSINLLHQLSKYVELTAVIHQDRDSFLKAVKEYPAIQNSTIISTKDKKPGLDLFSFLPSKIAKALRFRYWNRSLKGSAESNFLLIYPLLIDQLKKQAFDYVILEDINILNITKLIRRFQPAAFVIYDAYNVNTRLADTAFKSGKILEKSYELIKKAEGTLSTLTDAVFTCSMQDLEELNKMNNGKLTGIIIPNGVTIPENIQDNESFKNLNANYILFCGSLDYLPNQEGLSWFCKEVFPLIFQKNPSVRLMVVGKGEPGNELRKLLDQEGIIFYGMVERVNDYYKKASIAVVPLLSGSGTRLKLLEAMGNEVVVVSTSTGAEGIEYVAGENIIIADDSKIFANSVLELLDNRVFAKSLATAAFTFVKEHYDWNIIGKKMNDYLQVRLKNTEANEGI